MDYSQEDIHDIVDVQRAFFNTGITFDVSWRIAMLKRLKLAILENEQFLIDALRADLGRSYTEAYFCDVGSVILEINEAISGLRTWARPEVHFSGITCFPSVITKVHKVPYGTTLIISPFNFPYLLSLGVLVAAIAGGNTAVIKASSKSKQCTTAIKRLLESIYPIEYVTVIDGGHDVADMCLNERFDKIFYTGSTNVAKHVLEKAAVNLTPVALELGGETGNWCIVRKDADLRDAARKIAFLKLCNSGQVCININQIAVAREVARDFIYELKSAFINQIGASAIDNPEYPHLIDRRAYDRCAAEVDEYRDRVVHGGTGNPDTLKYEPTVLYPIDIDEPVVQHELFCPILPVVEFADAEIDGLLRTIASREHGLSLYVFTRDIRWANRVMATQQYGGGCINEVCLHLMVKGAPFNGVGHSGMGAYHGEWGFREFTHPSTVLRGSTLFNLPLRDHPYTGEDNAWKLPLLKIVQR